LEKPVNCMITFLACLRITQHDTANNGVMLCDAQYTVEGVNVQMRVIVPFHENSWSVSFISIFQLLLIVEHAVELN
jgi:hypothetical protein